MQSGHKLVLDDALQSVTLKHSNGCELVMNIAGQVKITANSTVEINASAVNVHAPMVNCDGVVVQTLITQSVDLAHVHTRGGQRMVNTCHHSWTVTAPWYEWARAGVPSSGRQTRPLIQKFASDNFIADFIKEPQRSLAFDARDDGLYTAQFVSAAPGAVCRQAGRAVPGEGRSGHPLQPG